MNLHKELSRTETGSDLISVVPDALIQKWSQLPAHAFSREKALECWRNAQGAWKDNAPVNVEQAIAAPSPTIGAVTKYIGASRCGQMVKELVTQVALLMNVGKGLHEAQIGIIADMLVIEYKYMTVADFQCAFRMGVLGQFGATYDRLDVTVLSDWLRRYWELRTSVSEGRSEVKRVVAADAEKCGPPPPDVQAAFKALHDRVAAKEKRRQPPVIDDAIISHWRAEWEAGNKEFDFETYKVYQIQKLKTGRK